MPRGEPKASTPSPPPLARAVTIAASESPKPKPGATTNPSTAPSTPGALLKRRAMSATLDKVREAMPSASGKKDLVQWFLPSEKHRKESLLESAQFAADAAEEARRACLASWTTLRSSIHAAVQVCVSSLVDPCSAYLYC